MKTIYDGANGAAGPRGPKFKFSPKYLAACAAAVAVIALGAFTFARGAQPADASGPPDPLRDPPQAMSMEGTDAGSGAQPMQYSDPGQSAAPELLYDASGQQAVTGMRNDLGDPAYPDGDGAADPDALADPLSVTDDPAADDGTEEASEPPAGTAEGADQSQEPGAGFTGDAADDPRIEALMAQVDALNKQLQEQEAELARQKAEREKAEREKAEQEAQAAQQQPEPSQDPADTAPPEWLQPAVPEPDPLEWLYTQPLLDQAAYWLGYDGGPLCAASYAEVPCYLAASGTRLYVEPGVPIWALSQGDLVHFVIKAVRNTTASWSTIVGSDGWGIQFYGNNTDFAVYGPLDENGQVTEVFQWLTITANGYAFTAA